MKRKIILTIATLIIVFSCFIFYKETKHLKLINNYNRSLEEWRKIGAKGQVIKNLKQGTWKDYFINDSIAEIINYKNDTLNGFCLEYAPDGSMVSSKKYRMGILVDTFKHFTNGLLDRVDYRDSTGQLQGKSVYYIDGHIFRTIDYLNDKFHGENIEYDLTSGKIREIHKYISGNIKYSIYFDSLGKDTIKIKKYPPR